MPCEVHSAQIAYDGKGCTSMLLKHDTFIYLNVHSDFYGRESLKINIKSLMHDNFTLITILTIG